MRPTSPISHTNTTVEETMDGLRELSVDPDLFTKIRVGDTDISWPQPRSALLSMREFSITSLEALEIKSTEIAEDKITRFIQYIIRLKKDEELLQPMEQLLAQLAVIHNPSTQLEDLALLQTNLEKQNLREELGRMEAIRTQYLKKSQKLFSVTREKRRLRTNQLDETIISTVETMSEEGFGRQEDSSSEKQIYYN